MLCGSCYDARVEVSNMDLAGWGSRPSYSWAARRGLKMTMILAVWFVGDSGSFRLVRGFGREFRWCAGDTRDAWWVLWGFGKGFVAGSGSSGGIRGCVTELKKGFGFGWQVGWELQFVGQGLGQWHGGDEEDGEDEDERGHDGEWSNMVTRLLWHGLADPNLKGKKRGSEIELAWWL